MVDATAQKIFSAIPFVWMLFYVIALVFVLATPSDNSRAKRMATIGLSLMLLLSVFSTAVRFMLSKGLLPWDVLMTHAAVSICDTLIGIAAMTLLIMAAFAGRSDLPRTADSLASHTRDSDTKNPYLPPGP